jgi:delta 1-pyrroline-5-carboxylate dehydrogenase
MISKNFQITKQDKLKESIEAYKHALRNNPKNQDARHNLYLAQQKLKQQEQQQQEQQKNQDQKKDQEQNKDKENQEQNQDQQNQDKKNQDKKDQQKQDQQNQQQNKEGQAREGEISKEDAERLLKALEEEEKDVLHKLQQEKAKSKKVKVEKEW